MPPDCIVCGSPSVRHWQSVAGQGYYRCGDCQATMLDPAQRLAPAAELAQYLDHQNDPDDPGYRRFLAQLATPLLERLPPRQQGLDYGCGAGPALAAMLREAGHQVELYDPFFFTDLAPLTRTYDFITCTEVIEHFHQPAAEFARFQTLLRPGGCLGLMTRFLTDNVDFAYWHYRRDPTHVVFYRPKTLQHIARRQGWSCEVVAPDVVLMRKPPG